MKALVLIAHGSRRAASNDEVRQLAARIADMQSDYSSVSAAFLELAEPLIPDGIVDAVDSGATEVTVMPYFLSAGRHVAEDIPAEVAKARLARPDAVIRVAPYLGSISEMAALLISSSDSTYCSDNPDCPKKSETDPFMVCNGDCQNS
jgi:sirohydrochlorin ferrochelatase